MSVPFQTHAKVFRIWNIWCGSFFWCLVCQMPNSWHLAHLMLVLLDCMLYCQWWLFGFCCGIVWLLRKCAKSKKIRVCIIIFTFLSGSDCVVSLFTRFCVNFMYLIFIVELTRWRNLFYFFDGPWVVGLLRKWRKLKENCVQLFCVFLFIINLFCGFFKYIYIYIFQRDIYGNSL